LIDELRGTARRQPLVAATFTLALAGLAGIPPLAGFAGKWFILAQILRTGDWVTYAGLAVFLANTVLSLAYYLPMIATLFSSPDPADDTAGVRISAWMVIPVVVLGLLVLAIGLWPGPWMEWVGHLITTVR
jgi:NADH:ubiquinone oxidoreductase subunit 2 (subunit N)